MHEAAPLLTPTPGPGPAVRGGRCALCATLLSALTACSSLPPRQPEAGDATPGTVQVQGAHGTLPPAARRATLRQVAAEGRHALFLNQLHTLTRSGDADL